MVLLSGLPCWWITMDHYGKMSLSGAVKKFGVSKFRHKELDSNQYWNLTFADEVFGCRFTFKHFWHILMWRSSLIFFFSWNWTFIHHAHVRWQRVTRWCTTQLEHKAPKVFRRLYLEGFGSVATDISAIFICWVSFDVLESCRILQLRGGICAHQSPVRWCWPCRDAHIDPVALGNSASKSGLRVRERKSGCKGRSHHCLHQRYRYIYSIYTCENSIGWILPDLLSGLWIVLLLWNLLVRLNLSSFVFWSRIKIPTNCMTFN